MKEDSSDYVAHLLSRSESNISKSVPRAGQQGDHQTCARVNCCRVRSRRAAALSARAVSLAQAQLIRSSATARSRGYAVVARARSRTQMRRTCTSWPAGENSPSIRLSRDRRSIQPSAMPRMRASPLRKVIPASVPFVCHRDALPPAGSIHRGSERSVRRHREPWTWRPTAQPPRRRAFLADFLPAEPPRRILAAPQRVRDRIWPASATRAGAATGAVGERSSEITRVKDCEGTSKSFFPQSPPDPLATGSFF